MNVNSYDINIIILLNNTRLLDIGRLVWLN